MIHLLDDLGKHILRINKNKDIYISHLSMSGLNQIKIYVRYFTVRNISHQVGISGNLEKGCR